MLTLQSILILMALHFVADQILQMKSVQVAKHKSTAMLLIHCLFWVVPIFFFGCYTSYITNNQYMALGWPLTLFVIHFFTEWGLNRLYTYFYHNKQLRMLLLFFFLENLIIMMSMVWLFNYFFWLGLNS